MMRMFFSCSFIVFSSAYALYTGSPFATRDIHQGIFLAKDPPLFFELGYQREWVTDKKMQTDAGESFPQFSYQTSNAGLFFDILDTVSLYGLAGSATSEYLIQSELDDLLTMISNYGFSWGVGGNALVLCYHKLIVGLGASYQTFHTRFNSLQVDGSLVAADRSKQHFQTWQTFLTIGYQNDIVVPYIGAKYTQASVAFDHLPADFYFHLDSFGYRNSFTAKSRNDGGIILGVSFTNSHAFSFTVEMELISADALTLASQMRF